MGFGVPRKNDNGRRVIDSYVEKRFSVRNTHYDHMNLHKYQDR